MELDNLKSFAEMQAELEQKAKGTPQPEETKVETNKEADVEQPEPTGDEPEGGEGGTEETTETKDTTPWGKSGKVPKGIAERFRKLTERDRIKDARIKELEGAMKRFVESGTKQTREPTLQDFLEAGKTETDYINYLVEQRLAQRSQVEEQRRNQEETIRRTQTELMDKWSKAIERSKNDLPDYDEVIANADVILPTPSMRYITESDIGPYISYTLASDEMLQSKIDSIPEPAGKHAVILELEKTLRAWLSNREKKVPSVQSKPSGTKPKVPGSLKNGSKTGKVLDPATSTIEEWLGIE